MPTFRPTSRTAPLRPTDLVLAVSPLLAGTIVGVVAGSGRSPWYRSLSKPGWTPPGFVFAPVWTLLYLLMGIASALVARTGDPRPRQDRGRLGRRLARPALALYALQLALNLAWSVVFFGLRRLRLAAAEVVLLWASVAATVVAFLRARALAGVLLLPYLAWTTFAAALTLEIARRNPRE